MTHIDVTTQDSRLTEKMVDCPVMTTIGVVGGKWKPRILWLLRKSSIRFGMLQRATDASTRMLARSLRELELDGVVCRTEVMVGGVTTAEYDFTPHGRSLIPVLDSLGDWGHEHKRTAHGVVPRQRRPGEA